MSIQLPRNAVSRRTIALAFALVTALTLWLAVDRTPAHAQDRALPNTGLADPANLVRLFNRWRTGASPNVLTIPLVSFGGLSAEVFDATGQVRLDLRARTLTSRVAGLPQGEWDWFMAPPAMRGRRNCRRRCSSHATAICSTAARSTRARGTDRRSMRKSIICSPPARSIMC